MCGPLAKTHYPLPPRHTLSATSGRQCVMYQWHSSTFQLKIAKPTRVTNTTPQIPTRHAPRNNAVSAALFETTVPPALLGEDSCCTLVKWGAAERVAMLQMGSCRILQGVSAGTWRRSQKAPSKMQSSCPKRKLRCVRRRHHNTDVPELHRASSATHQLNTLHISRTR